MSERQVDFESPSEANDDLGLRHYRDEKRTKVFEEGLYKKAQSHTDRGEGVTLHEIQGGRITDKLHLHRGEVQDLLNPCRIENDNQSPGRANSATNRPIRHPRGDARKVLPQLEAITTCQIDQTKVVRGHVLIPEVGDLPLSTEPSHHAEHRQPVQDQARGANLPQSIHTSQDATDTIHLIRLSAHNASDLDHHRTEGLALLHLAKSPRRGSYLHANSLLIRLDCRRQRNCLHVSLTKRIQIFQS